MEDVAWRTVNPGNMTTNNRTGANNADMDESDLRSVGVDVSTRQQGWGVSELLLQSSSSYSGFWNCI